MLAWPVCGLEYHRTTDDQLVGKNITHQEDTVHDPLLDLKKQAIHILRSSILQVKPCTHTQTSSTHPGQNRLDENALRHSREFP